MYKLCHTYLSVVSLCVFALTSSLEETIDPSSSSSPTPQSSSLSLSPGDVHIINLHHLSEVSISPQSQQNGLTSDPSALPAIDTAKVRQRLQKNVEKRWKEIRSKGVNVSEEAQKLFDVLMQL